MEKSREKLLKIYIFIVSCAVFLAGVFFVRLKQPIVTIAAEAPSIEFVSVTPSSDVNSSTISFSVSIPSSYLNLLKQGRTETSRSYTDYFLVIGYSENDTDVHYGNYYHIDQTEEITVPDGYDSVFSPYPYENTLTDGFLSGGQGTFSIEIPRDLKKEYYYRAEILKTAYTVEFDSEYAGSVTISGQTDQILSHSGSYKNSIWNIGISKLEGDESLSDAKRVQWQEMLGIKPSASEIDVVLRYKKLVEYATVEEKEYAFKVKSAYAQNKSLITSEMYKVSSFRNIADFNAVYTGDYYRDGYKYTLQERIILQARDFNYSYNEETERGALEVVYNDFQYKDLSLRVTNNDPANNLTIDYYTSDAVVSGNITTLTYNFEQIEEQLYNSCKWLFDFGKENIRIGGTPAGVTTQLTDTALIVTFSNDKEKELVNLSLIGVAEIIEDVEYTLTYEYIQIGCSDGEITETVKESEPVTVWYTNIVTYNYDNFMVDYGSIVNAAARPLFLDGVEYCIPKSIHKDYSKYEDENHICKIVVEYEYNAIFIVTDNLDGEETFRPVNHISLFYTGDYFLNAVPDGYRVKNFETDSKDKLIITNAEDYRKTKVEIRADTHSKTVLSVRVNFTDSWNLRIDYLETYADYRMRTGEKDENGNLVSPCFAEKKLYVGEIKVGEYKDIYSLTSADIKEILKVQSLDILGLATVEKVEVKFDGVATYTAELSYSHAALKQIDYNGNVVEIKIPLTSFADWCKQYGKNWSILFLNTEERHYFKYSNDVARENLYGFFSVAVFEEQISDLNYWFRKNTGDGCMTIFREKRVSGSDIYKFFNARIGKDNILMSLLGYVGMHYCETINDDNTMYYSYFFYLDGTSDNAYLSNGGADNADDTDSAINNALQNVGNWFKKVWNDIDGSNAMKWVKIVLGIVLIVVVIITLISLGYKILSLSGMLDGKAAATGKIDKAAAKKPIKSTGSESIDKRKKGSKSKKAKRRKKGKKARSNR